VAFAGLYPDLGVKTALRESGRRALARDALLIPTIGSRGSPAYNVHSYHTKVPPEAIEPYIKHYTNPGAVVLDPFAGSGMTGVAARRLGRRSILNDLSPAAAHIAWNVTHRLDPVALESAANRLMSRVDALIAEVYKGRCGRCDKSATIAFTIWSDRVACRDCARPLSIWRTGTDRSSGVVAPRLSCEHCGEETVRRGAARVDRVPEWVATDCLTCGRVERPIDARDLAAEASWHERPIEGWYPTTPIAADREMYIRSALGMQAIRSVADFYTRRNLHALAGLWAELISEPDIRLRQALALAFTNTAWHGTIMRRFNTRGGQRPLTGTLYVPHLQSEANVGRVFTHKIRQLLAFYRSEWGSAEFDDDVSVTVGSATKLSRIPDHSIDYVFTDPPFGSNIFYADCNLIWESWLGSLTDPTQEAVVNRSLKPGQGGKTVTEYEALIRGSFVEVARTLRRGAWMTVVFHSTDAKVWQAIEDAINDAGLSISGATYLDKTQMSHKGYKGRSGAEDVAAYDVVLAVRNSGPRLRATTSATRRQDAVRILRDHLDQLPALDSDPEADRLRTLPYLHSLLVQWHFNGDIGLHVGGYDTVREICEKNFVQDSGGRWRTLATRQQSKASRGGRIPPPTTKRT
jgi:16S rRNA G966 N2-methylase RsmD